MTTDSTQAGTAEQPAVTRHDDGSITVLAPYWREPIKFRAVIPLDYHQARAVHELAHQRAMGKSSEILADQQRAAAHKAVADALEALLGGGR